MRMAQQAKDKARENYTLIDRTSLTAFKRITAVKAEYFAVLIISVHLVEADKALFIGVTPQISSSPVRAKTNTISWTLLWKYKWKLILTSTRTRCDYIEGKIFLEPSRHFVKQSAVE